ncbi:MAG: hypothetical protein ABH951_01565 [Patescibacteria group bacterium]
MNLPDANPSRASFTITEVLGINTGNLPCAGSFLNSYPAGRSGKHQ